MPSANLNHQLTLDTLPAPLFSLLNGEIKQDTRLTSVMSCIADLNALATVLRAELATNGDAIWDDEERMGFLMNPVAYHLLRQQPAISGRRVQRSDMISEALRLGSTVWIIEVKRRCRSYPGTARSWVSALLNILSEDTDLQSIWSRDSHLQTVRLWLLILCGIGETSDQDHELAMRMIVGVIKKHRLASWKGIMVDIRRMPWLDIFESRCATLGQQIKGNFT
ncbi:uncharacterized protein N7515_000163 [Penicillium bovifimosum]|uniref:Uncharacterized protein n=1 Tax=Penicillium bovifimosum TaxID=126998 RepID=A0A9W9L9N6_9EURO|nr:uncharacterized protein N7515_000163 [Penicillium bovifimosum]KAJ5145599.1 hypothetical protein N7515_000163 [Penicillium bovifimosum]